MRARAELAVPPDTKAETDTESTARHSQLVLVPLEGQPVQILSHLDALSMWGVDSFVSAIYWDCPLTLPWEAGDLESSPCPAPNEPVTWGESDP